MLGSNKKGNKKLMKDYKFMDNDEALGITTSHSRGGSAMVTKVKGP